MKVFQELEKIQNIQIGGSKSLKMLFQYTKYQKETFISMLFTKTLQNFLALAGVRVLLIFKNSLFFHHLLITTPKKYLEPQLIILEDLDLLASQLVLLFKLKSRQSSPQTLARNKIVNKNLSTLECLKYGGKSLSSFTRSCSHNSSCVLGKPRDEIPFFHTNSLSPPSSFEVVSVLMANASTIEEKMQWSKRLSFSQKYSKRETFKLQP